MDIEGSKEIASVKDDADLDDTNGRHSSNPSITQS